MDREALERFHQARCELFKAHDSLERLIDGLDERAWDNADFGYACAQLLRTLRALKTCSALMHAEGAEEADTPIIEGFCLDCNEPLIDAQIGAYKLDREKHVRPICHDCCLNRDLV